MGRMAARDASIGERIEARRRLHGWSIRHAASRAGISHTTWSRVERGLMSADNRFLLSTIATALECSVTDLAQQPATPTDRETAAAQSAVQGITQTIIETDIAEAASCEPRPLAELERDAALVGDLRLRCDYTGAARILPGLLRELHAATHGPDRARALRVLIRTVDHASFIVRYVGYPTDAWLAAERGHQAAELLEDPVMLGLAAWSRAHAATGCGSYARALSLAEREATQLARHQGQHAAPEVLGQLHMTAAFASYAMGRKDACATHVNEATAIAERTGDSHALGLNFGPTNINCWWISMEVDGGEPGRAVEIARRTNPAAAGLTVSRQVGYYTDTARALARTRHDREAVRMLLTAERLAPVRVRASSLVRETARSLLQRARAAAGGPELRGLCERVGVPD